MRRSARIDLPSLIEGGESAFMGKAMLRSLLSQSEIVATAIYFGEDNYDGTK